MQSNRVLVITIVILTVFFSSQWGIISNFDHVFSQGESRQATSQNDLDSNDEQNSAQKELNNGNNTTHDDLTLTKTEKKLWCVLCDSNLRKNQRNYFFHFPHALEAILPCYSTFIEKGAIKTTATGTDKSLAVASLVPEASNCGFFFTDSLVSKLRANQKETHAEPISNYIRDIIKAMGCELIFGATPEILPKEKNDYFYPNIYLSVPRYDQIRYLAHHDHASPLRRQFVSDEYIQSIKGEGKPLQIGMIQRPKSRHISNFEQVRDEIQRLLPDSNITLETFNYTKAKDQAEWFASKDVIIGAHGAAMANSLWITPRTIVYQLYPPRTFFTSMEPLIEQVGGIAIQWYDKDHGDPKRAALDANDKERNRIMASPFDVNVHDVVLHLIYALGKEEPSYKSIARLYGTKPLFTR